MKNEEKTITRPPGRIGLVDALRGVALTGILLCHVIEHFDFGRYPETSPDWLLAIDGWVHAVIYFFFSGKAYAMFAFLFGLSFFIQMDRQAQKGNNYRLRFIWRLFILLIFGYFNSIFFPGDALTYYAVLGLFLVLIYPLKTKYLILIGGILFFQPVELGKIIYALSHPDYAPALPFLSEVNAMYDEQAAVIIRGNFWETAWFNVTTGQTVKWLWYWEVGRVPQTLALFIFGMLAGRTHLFEKTIEMKSFWKQALGLSFLLFLPFYYLKLNLADYVTREALFRPLDIIVSSFTNMAFLAFLISSVVLLYQAVRFSPVLVGIEPLGRMSLTNYVGQSLLGTPFFYGYGLAMYQYCGITLSLLAGIVIFTIQLTFSYWWLKRHRRGPLEQIWYRATWLFAPK